MTSSAPIVYSPFARLVGLTITTLNREHCECVLELGEKHLNIHGTVHGGAIYTLVDVGMGSALHAHLTRDERCVTVEIKINYLAAVTRGLLDCHTRILHKTRKLAVLESEIKCDGDLVAKAIGTFYVTRAKRG